VYSGEAPGAVGSVREAVQKRGDDGGLLGTWMFASMEKRGRGTALFKEWIRFQDIQDLVSIFIQSLNRILQGFRGESL
jgi:hypothetical protein